MRTLLPALTILLVISVTGSLGCAGTKWTLQKEALILSELKGGKTLSIRLFTVACIPKYDDEPVGNLRRYLVEKLAFSLRELNVFSDIRILAENEDARTDLVFEGEFTDIDEGEREGVVQGMLSGGKPQYSENIALLAFKGRIIKMKDSLVVYEPRGISMTAYRCLLCPSAETVMHRFVDAGVKVITEDLKAELL